MKARTRKKALKKALKRKPNRLRPTEPAGRHRSASSISPATSWHRKDAIDACWIAKLSEQLRRRVGRDREREATMPPRHPNDDDNDEPEMIGDATIESD